MGQLGRVKKFWLVLPCLLLGDRNKKKFHLSTIRRRHHNKIWGLKDFMGYWTYSPPDIQNQILSHFINLYSFDSTYEQLSFPMPYNFPSIPPSAYNRLAQNVTDLEIKEAIFSFKPLKAIAMMVSIPFSSRNFGILLETLSHPSLKTSSTPGKFHVTSIPPSFASFPKQPSLRLCINLDLLVSTIPLQNSHKDPYP